jgi:glycerol transport system ATP-binding protein
MTLQLKNITKQVGGETHLETINLTLEKGSFNVILGPTLSGKTTLLRLIAGLDSPSSGQLLMDGQDLSSIPVWRRKVAMVYQQFINYPNLNVYENIAFPLQRMKLPQQEIDRKVKAVAELLQIENYLQRKPRELSGGQQQRTALARSLVKGADLLLMDEPLINLDYKLREQIRDEFKNIFKTNGDSIIIYSTTDPLEALQLGGNILILNEGRQLQNGPTHHCFRNPQTEEVAKVFNDPPMNMIDGNVSNDHALLGRELKVPRVAHLKNLPDGSYRFGLRASDLFLKQQDSSDNVLPATIDLGEISGSETFIHARHNDASWVIHELGIHGHGLGENINAYFNASNLFVFTPEGQLVAVPETICNSSPGPYLKTV